MVQQANNVPSADAEDQGEVVESSFFINVAGYGTIY
jgi:hypothetical protein